MRKFFKKKCFFKKYLQKSFEKPLHQIKWQIFNSNVTKWVLLKQSAIFHKIETARYKSTSKSKQPQRGISLLFTQVELTGICQASVISIFERGN